MAEELRFDGKVVIITGAGNGLGRAHALSFGARGAKVVVNDLGGSAFGDGKSASAADKVVDEIRAAGGEAVANYDSVENGEAIVKTALDAFGRVDIVVNNAGILRDVSFHKMTEQDWELIFKVHVLGAFRVTHAAWPHMRAQGSGRVIFTSSAAGIYGNFGQANYGAAKLAQLGMANTLAVEGRKSGIHVNTIAPIAASRLTETVMPKEVLAWLAPEAVTPLVAWLCHDSCEENGGVFEVGGGFFSKLRWQRTKGKTWRIGRPLSAELVRDEFAEITRFGEDSQAIGSIQESMAPVMENLQKGKSKGGNQFVDVDSGLGYVFPKIKSSYDERDLVIYALGIGAGRNPTSTFDLSLVYEGFGGGFKAFPTYGVVPALNTLFELGKQGKNAPGMNYGFDRVLHGEQYLELKRPLPTKGKLEHTAKVKEIWDKGKGAVVVTAVTSVDEDGDELMYNEISSFIRGAGGWGGDRGPSADVNVPPDRKPDAVVEEKTERGQALLYRQAGDWNPLHADPDFAKAFGFKEPILHGLCTFGFAVRHVLESCAPDANPSFFKSVKVRFAESVFPGETLVTEMWKESPTRIVFRTKVKERDAVVISNAAIELFAELPKPKAKKPVAAAGATTKAAVEPRDVFAVMHDYLLSNPEVSKKVGTVYGFKLKNPDAYFTVDAKNGTGAQEGETAQANCTMELSTEDFLALTRGEANPQKLFSGGKLKISGDMMAAMKLDFLTKLNVADFQKKADARGGAGGGAAAKPADAPVEPRDVFAVMHEYLLANPEVSKKVGTVYGFKLKNPDAYFTVDAKNGTGAQEGESIPASCTMELSTEDFLALTRGEANPQKLFSGGKLKIGGDMMAAMKLDFLTKLNVADFQKKANARAGSAGGSAAKPAPAAAKASEPSATGKASAAEFVAALRKGLPAVKDGASGKLVLRVLSPDSAFTIDFGSGSVSDGAEKGVETVVTVKDEDLAKLRSSTPLASLFQKGVVRVDGPMAPMHHLSLLPKV